MYRVFDDLYKTGSFSLGKWWDINIPDVEHMGMNLCLYFVFCSFNVGPPFTIAELVYNYKFNMVYAMQITLVFLELIVTNFHRQRHSGGPSGLQADVGAARLRPLEPTAIFRGPP